MNTPDVLDWELDEEDTVEIRSVEPAEPTQVQQSQQPQGNKTTVGSRPALYLDFETAPDTERMELFGLPPLPEVQPVRSSAECPDPATTLIGSLDLVERKILDLNPDDSYLELLIAAENTLPKPRAGVAKLCDSIKKQRIATAGAEGERRKLLSVTPEYCRIVAFGFAVGDGPTGSYLAADCDLPGGVANCWSGMTEKQIVEEIWEKIRTASQVIGFNVLQFDLQVLKVRSVLLGVEPSRWLNDSPFSNRDVCDLMLARFGKGGKPMKLKQLARLYGVPVPAGDTDGSDVERMLAEDPAAVHRYVQSDVEVTRSLHRKWSGVFCL